MFTPKIGEMIPNLTVTYFSKMGWFNHQLVRGFISHFWNHCMRGNVGLTQDVAGLIANEDDQWLVDEHV